MATTLHDRHFPIEQVSDERLRQAVTILTTEHFTLQTARGTVTSEATARLTIFLGAVSGALIAIGFIGQASQLGEAFRVFTLLLLPALLLLGLATLGRLRQCNQQDLLHGYEMNRIRHFYVELVPELRDYFLLSTHDDFHGALANIGVVWSSWQMAFTLPTVVSSLNALIAGVLAGLLASWVPAWPLAVAVACGFVGGIGTMAAEVSVARRRIRSGSAMFAPLFPSHPRAQ